MSNGVVILETLRTVMVRLMTILLALTSGLMWGAADFFGGSALEAKPA